MTAPLASEGEHSGGLVLNKLLLGSNEVTEERGGGGVILSHFDFRREERERERLPDNTPTKREQTRNRNFSSPA